MGGRGVLRSISGASKKFWMRRVETAALTMMLTMKGKRCSGTVSTSKSASDVKARDDVSGCFSRCG